jgi:hypothetical protein
MGTHRKGAKSAKKKFISTWGVLTDSWLREWFLLGIAVAFQQFQETVLPLRPSRLCGGNVFSEPA